MAKGMPSAPDRDGGSRTTANPNYGREGAEPALEIIRQPVADIAHPYGLEAWLHPRHIGGSRRFVHMKIALVVPGKVRQIGIEKRCC
jgi:hypothetical protein